MNLESSSPDDQKDNFAKELLAEAKKFNKLQKLSMASGIAGIAVRLAVVALIAVVIFNKVTGEGREEKYSTIIEINGAISSISPNNKSETINKKINEAFHDDNSAGIILKLNSPGGSPVESDLVYKNIMKNRANHPEKRIYSLVGDLCASGCYYIASATEQIFSNENSIIGSIGAIWSGFGFVTALDKLGIERRIITSGKNKALLDPFRPATHEDQEAMRELVKQVHNNFIEKVIAGRPDKIRVENYDTVFSGKGLSKPASN